MNSEMRALEAEFRRKPAYRRIFDAYRLMFGEDEYASLNHLRKRRGEVAVIDQINFSRKLFIDPLPVADIASALPIEPGYGTSSGELELGQIVREFEERRATAYRQTLCDQGQFQETVRLDDTTVAIGSGVTGSLALAMAGVAQFERDQGGSRQRVWYSIPGYSMPDEIAHTFSLEALPYGQPNGTQLPDLLHLHESFDTDALAYVLTYPTNPAQTCYGRNDTALLRQFIQRCQSSGTFLIVDTIFQDMRWTGDPAPEVFAMSETARCLIKVFGPSKDTPFACGLRIGYMIGDIRLRPYVDKLSSVLLNSHNFYSKVWLGLDLLLRNDALSVESLKPFEGNFILGNHGRELSARELYKALRRAGICERYAAARQHNSHVLDCALTDIHRYLTLSQHFQVGPRPRFGNILLVHLSTEDACESELSFFLRVLFEANVGVLVGNFFGVPEGTNGISFRVVVAAESAEWVIDKLRRIEDIL